MPRYDKTAHGGRGDRVSEDRWPVVVPPIDVVLFEGWMTGFRFEEDPGKITDPDLLQVNEFLKAYDPGPTLLVPNLTLTENAPLGCRYEPLYGTFDCFVHLEAENLSYVYEWRLEAERKTRLALGEKAAMTDEQVRDFVDRFMPAYRQYLPSMKADPLARGHHLHVIVSKDRDVLKSEEL